VLTVTRISVSEQIEPNNYRESMGLTEGVPD